jgi:hypothetical protein
MTEQQRYNNKKSDKDDEDNDGDNHDAKVEQPSSSKSSKSTLIKQPPHDHFGVSKSLIETSTRYCPASVICFSACADGQKSAGVSNVDKLGLRYVCMTSWTCSVQFSARHHSHSPSHSPHYLSLTLLSSFSSHGHTMAMTVSSKKGQMVEHVHL